MLQRFYPDAYVDSAYGIDYEKLYGEGYRGIIFDVDNTLVPHGAPADSRSIELFSRLKALGYEIVRLSNNKCLTMRWGQHIYLRRGNLPWAIIRKRWRRWVRIGGIPCL